jgi:hypothetical protein
MGCRAAQLAEEHGVFRVLRPFIDRGQDVLADPRYFHIADK